ncbi:hypothetical protein PFISCL1PPCAC_6704, partial [Pristionchus fissidentatus]
LLLLFLLPLLFSVRFSCLLRFRNLEYLNLIIAPFFFCFNPPFLLRSRRIAAFHPLSPFLSSPFFFRVAHLAKQIFHFISTHCRRLYSRRVSDLENLKVKKVD